MTTNTTELRVGARAIAAFTIMILLLALVLFVAAGTFAWPVAWAYVIAYLVAALGSRIILLIYHPDLATERGRYGEAEGVLPGDRAMVMVVGLIGPFVTLLVAGLDHRFGWTPPLPPAVELVGLAATVLAMAFSTWALIANRFFSAVVRIQADRGQTVVTGGPYRFVRHPGYAGGILAGLATPFALGALWALIPAVLTAGVTVVRTAREDRLLQKELPGYAAYGQRTRYRLLPGVW